MYENVKFHFAPKKILVILQPLISKLINMYYLCAVQLALFFIIKDKGLLCNSCNNFGIIRATLCQCCEKHYNMQIEGSCKLVLRTNKNNGCTNTIRNIYIKICYIYRQIDRCPVKLQYIWRRSTVYTYQILTTFFIRLTRQYNYLFIALELAIILFLEVINQIRKG